MLELSSLRIIPDSSVGIMNRLMAGRPKNRISFLGRRTVFFFPTTYKSTLKAIHAYVKWVPGPLF